MTKKESVLSDIDAKNINDLSISDSITPSAKNMKEKRMKF